MSEVQSMTLTDEQREFRDVLRQFVADKIVPLAPEIDRTAEYSWATFEALKSMELTALSYPAEYGGSGAFDFYLVDFDGVGDKCDLCPYAFDPDNSLYKDENNKVWPSYGKYCRGVWDPEAAPRLLTKCGDEAEGGMGTGTDTDTGGMSTDTTG